MPEVFIDPPPSAGILEPDAEIHPGFGIVALSRDGVEVARDVNGERNLAWYTRRVRREQAPHKPTPVWALHIDGPFRSKVYAYTSDSQWSLIDTKDGFA